MERCPKCILVLGLSLICFGVILGFFLFPHMLQKNIRQKMRLEEGGDIFNRWVDVKIPIFMKVYFFNITNKDEFISGSKPILEEIGPYVYQQKRQKVVEFVGTGNDTIQFRPKITYFFRSDKSSPRTEEDIINFINVPLLSVTTKALSEGTFVRSLIRSVVGENLDIFEKRSVGELLFKGYHVPIIEELSELKGEQLMPDNKFAFYYDKNGTAQDLLEIYSGVIDNQKFGDTISWNGETKLNYWETEYCNMINGSDGSLFAPAVTRDRVLRIFSPDMCRSMVMTYVEDVELKGVPAYRFTTPKHVMQSPRDNPDNICYCSNPGQNFEGCTKSGVFRIGKCKKGAPIVASWPHFFDGDEEYLNQSIGLKPDKDRHETFISLEPNTGALLQASKRFQVNIELKKNKHFPSLKKLPQMILPLLWGDESVVLPDETAAMLQKELLNRIKIVMSVMYGLYAVGALLIVIAFIVNFCQRRKGNSSSGKN